jgi:hypothetical protein
MDNFKTMINNFDNKVTNLLSPEGNNQYILVALSLFLIIYASYIAQKLPTYILKLFDNTFFKLLIFFFIVYLAKKNSTIAIIASVGLIITIQSLNKFQMNQTIKSLVSKEKKKIYNKLQINNQLRDQEMI